MSVLRGVLRQDFVGYTFRRPGSYVQHLSPADYHERCVNTPGGPIGNELEIRSLRYFVAAAEELNFTRAAARLFVAQQALSREIKRLEARLGTTLFLRTTRRVTLTPDGERLLVRARDLVARHDTVWADVHVPRRSTDRRRPHERGTAHGDPDPRPGAHASAGVDFRGRYTGGTGAALESLATGRLDVVLGRVDWLGRLRCRPSITSSSGSNRWPSSCPPGIRWPSWKRSRFAASRGSRSMGCRPIRTLPNGQT